MVSTNFFARAAVLLAAAAQVSASGSAIIHNQCDFDVYLWSIADTDSSMQTLKANGGEYTEAYRVNADGGGISIKMGVETKCRNVTQYEYTFVDDGIWYDLSNINGYPFAEFGVTVVPSISSCRSVSCPAGTSLCAAAYNVPTDNYATAECSADADTVVVLCSYEDSTSGSASVTSVAVSAAASASTTYSHFTSAASSASSTDVAEPITTTAAEAFSTQANSQASHTVWQHQSYNVQAPTTTAAAEATVVSNPFLVIETTFITHVVTVEGRSVPTAAAEVEKRHAHGHRAAHEHPAKRHSHPHAPKVDA